MGVRRRAQRVTGGGGGGGAMEVTPRPKASTRVTNDPAISTVPGVFTEIISYVPDDEKTFALSNITVSWEGDNEQEIVAKMDGEIIGKWFSTQYVSVWFAAGVDLVGDGIKTVLIEAKAVATGADLTGFIGGELT